MVTYETKGRLTYKDENGDNHIIYPATKKECVEGLSAIELSIGNLSRLNTTTKSNLVAALNEVLSTRGGDVSVEDVQDIVVAYLAENPPAYSPVRGEDYWTAADIAEIKSYVDEAILGGAW